MKYADTLVGFSEVPGEISLCVNVSGCKIHCQGCHSQHLWEDIGTPLTRDEAYKLIKKNEGITCFCLMGGDDEIEQVISIAQEVKSHNLKFAWYSGRETVHSLIYSYLKYFDFIKVGPYIESKGPLNKKTTNQKFYEVVREDYPIPEDFKGSEMDWFSEFYSHNLKDITYKFWENEN